VPEDYLMDLEPSRLQIREGAVFRTENGYNHPIQQADVEHWLKEAPRNADGKIRVVASRFIPGKVVGQYRYVVADIHTLHPDFPHWTKPVRVSLRSGEGKVDVVGGERPRNEGKDAAR
jgi:hypothetical protein